MPTNCGTNAYKNGAISSFESDEFRFVLDEQGKPVEVIKKVRVDAHKMIEDYMLLANKTIAKHVYTKIKKGAAVSGFMTRRISKKWPSSFKRRKNSGIDIDTKSNEAISATNE